MGQASAKNASGGVNTVEPTGFWNWLLGESLPRVKPQVPVIWRRRQTEDLQQTLAE
jgi:hypothetical protein